MIKRILLTTDLSGHSKYAVEYAVALADSFRAKLYLLHFYEHSSTSVGAQPHFLPDPKFIKDVGHEKESLSLSVQQLGSTDLDVQPTLEQGKVYEEIVKAAKALEIDLIILATHWQKGLSHFVFGSTAEKVVRLASCPVLTLKYPELESANKRHSPAQIKPLEMKKLALLSESGDLVGMVNDLAEMRANLTH